MSDNVALALVFGQAVVAVAILLMVRSFGRYTEAIGKNTEALVKANQFEQAIHEENRKILLKLLKLDPQPAGQNIGYPQPSHRESA